MSDAKYTPGPWHINYPRYIIKDEERTYTVVGPPSDWMFLSKEEDARLIAAAPELLEALEAIYNSINLPTGLGKKATEAIQKAKGVSDV